MVKPKLQTAIEWFPYKARPTKSCQVLVDTGNGVMAAYYHAPDASMAEECKRDGLSYKNWIDGYFSSDECTYLPKSKIKSWAYFPKTGV